MTAAEILGELQQLGNPACRGLLMRNHGAKDPCFGVRIGDMQPLRKRIGTDYRLALDLYETGNYDAMYFAGLIADDARMTRRDLQRWVAAAYAPALWGTSVPSVAAGSPHGHDLALAWTDSPKPKTAAAGWATLSCIVSVKPDSELDTRLLKSLLQRVQQSIHSAPDPVRYQMNSFVISAGSFVPELTEAALRAAEAIGPVTVDTGNNACRVPSAADCIRKVEARGTLGRKRKSAKC